MIYPKLVIEFIDGKIIDVRCDQFQVRDGVLVAWDQGGAFGTYGHRYFPLVNIREYGKQE